MTEIEQKALALVNEVRRLLGAVAAGWAGFSLAVGVGIPVWVDWPSWEIPADATDIGALIAAATLWLTTGSKD